MLRQLSGIVKEILDRQWILLPWTSSTVERSVMVVFLTKKSNFVLDCQDLPADPEISKLFLPEAPVLEQKLDVKQTNLSGCSLCRGEFALSFCLHATDSSSWSHISSISGFQSQIWSRFLGLLSNLMSPIVLLCAQLFSSAKFYVRGTAYSLPPAGIQLQMGLENRHIHRFFLLFRNSLIVFLLIYSAPFHILRN